MVMFCVTVCVNVCVSGQDNSFIILSSTTVIQVQAVLDSFLTQTSSVYAQNESFIFELISAIANMVAYIS